MTKAKKKMTTVLKKQEVVKRLKLLASCVDAESAHAEADEILCDFLKHLGYPEIVRAYKKIHRWYA